MRPAFDSSASVSVIIAVYNGAKYLAPAIESVRAQTLAPLEIVVVDDGSTDDTAQVAQSFADVTYLHQENQGSSAARNLGVQNARGDVLAFLDADDLWLPRKLEIQLAALQNDPSLHCVFGQVEQFLSPDLSPAERATVRVPTELMPGYCPSAFLVRRDDFLHVGWFEANLEVGEFIDWYLRAIERNFKAVAPAELVVRRRIHTTNTGIVNRNARQYYVRVLKASLDRRRQQQSRSHN